jgi:tetratricopeptide (TPR) repeat protein
MPAVEALFRVWTIKAGNGDSKAASVVNKLHEMAGLESRVAQGAPPRIQIPRGNSPEQFDLLKAPEREKDRQKYLAMAEFYEDARVRRAEGGSIADEVPPAVKDGDRFAQQGEPDKALAAYRSQLEICKEELTADSRNKIAQYNFRRAVARIGLLADRSLLAGEHASAFSIAEEAIVAAASGFWVAPEHMYYQLENTIWIHIIRALALMFLPGGAEAQAYLIGFRTDLKLGFSSCEQVILRDLAKLRATGHSNPMMDEIEKHYYDAGWARHTREDIDHWVDVAFIHAADIKSANVLANRGKLNEAFVEYDRILNRCEMDLAIDQTNRLVRAELNLVVWQIGRLTRKFILAGHFSEGLICSKQSLKYDPNSTSVNLDRAHALMFLGEDEQASEIYLGYHGKKVSARSSVQQFLREDFRQLTEAGHSSKLMNTIERRFAAMDEAETIARKNAARSANGPFSNKGSLLPSNSPARTPVLRPPAPILLLSELDICAAAKELIAKGELDQAIEVYKRCISRCVQILANVNNSNMRLHEERREAIDGIVEAAFCYLLNNKDEKAREACEYVLSVVPNLPFAKVRLAHILMLSGNRDEALHIYHELRARKITSRLTCAEIILQDLKRLREHKREDDLMGEIEALFSSPEPQQQGRELFR